MADTMVLRGRGDRTQKGPTSVRFEHLWGGFDRTPCQGPSEAPAAASGRRRLFAMRQLPVRPRVVAVVTVGVALEVILMLGLGLPERGRRADLGHHLARPHA